jgi:hypothetical protein
MPDSPSACIHLMMRYSDALMGVEDTIAEHAAVIKKYGAVLVGKVGKGLGVNHVTKLNKQCCEGHGACLFLVQNRGRPGHPDYIFHRGDLEAVSLSLAPRERRLVPAYYKSRGIDRQASVWCKVTQLKQVTVASMAEYHIASSRRPVFNALTRSLAALFVLGEGKGINY